jgi:hypothetical protein
MIILLLILWYLIGVASFIYQWTAQYDFATGDIIFAIICGSLGPIAFLISWKVIGLADGSVIIRKRK